MYDTDPADLIDFANRWMELGSAVTEQVNQVLDNPTCGSCWNEGSEHDVNPAAIELAYHRLQVSTKPSTKPCPGFLESVAE